MKTTLRLLLLWMACASISGCSKTNILKTIDIKVTELNQEQFISMSAKLNLGNAVFDSLQIPVRDPKTGIEIGYLGLSTGADGAQTVSLGLNASVALNANPDLGRTFPNGRELPVTLGVQSGEVLAFPILNHSRIYIGGDLKNKIVIGVALAVKALDGVANLAGAPANVFFGLNVNPNLYGVAGLYGSPLPDESGIAVFGRLQIPVAPAPGVITIAKKAVSRVQQSATGLAASVSNQATPDADQLHPRSERKVTHFFYGKRRVIRVQ